jgi:hypothetical protein
MPHYALSEYDTLHISAQLDTVKKQIHGMMEYRLPSAPKLTSFEFQLYPNVYSSENSPYLIGKPRLLSGFQQTNSWGGTDVDSVLLDHKNVTDLVQVDFTKGVLSPENIAAINGKTVKIFFRTYIPRLGDRLAFNGDNYILGNWFPIPAILKSDGSWYNPKYGAFSEPYGDYYQYEIDFILPSNLRAAAAVAPDTTEVNSTQADLHFSFGPAQEFAMALSPNYFTDTMNYNGVTIKIFYRDYEQSLLDKIKTTAQHTLDYMNKYVGKYAYKSLTYAMVDAASVGGIEYPGFVFLNSPQGGAMVTRFYESLVAHETIHQWFYCMIGTDQVESPWMDEAVADLFTLKIMEKYWGTDANLYDFAGLKFTERDEYRSMMHTILTPCALEDPSYAFVNESDYFNTIYSRGGLVLETFDNMLGDSLSPVFWQLYFELYRFKHPRQEDFINLVDQIAGDNVRDNLNVLLSSPNEIDYGVDYLMSNKIDSTTYQISFDISRKGDLPLPIDYAIILYNGDTVSGQWTPQYDRAKIVDSMLYPAKAVIVDPNNIIAVDANLFDNSALAQSDNRPGLRLSSGLMFLIESFFSFIGGM